MNKQTLYIIIIIALFNFLLINIFRLQKEVTKIRERNNKIKGIIKQNNYKKINKINDNNNGTGSSEVKDKLNEIAELVPISFNKIVESKDKFIPKDKQV